MTSVVLSELKDGVFTITLNRPERLNAINPALLAELTAALSAANGDAGVRAIVLCGAGRAFCAGDDLKEFDQQGRSPAEVRAYVETIQEVTRAISLGNKMVVGAIHGWAVGGGLEWVINCDLAIMAEGTRCFFPEIGLGVFVTGGVTTLLPKLVGLRRARELILFGERFDARAALEMGIAWKVVPPGELMAAAQATARRIAALPAAQVSDLKRVLNRACHLDLEGALALETEATVRGFLDPETRARVARFGK
ncbi:MAG TPA: enoyl-CoA hydratase/isomerase family protein [Alphaproteobacteria bacterium]|nr:enoyl-CoA hydratase/isomerase family protein [Alphaproteobacteria bacterium]